MGSPLAKLLTVFDFEKESVFWLEHFAFVPCVCEAQANEKGICNITG